MMYCPHQHGQQMPTAAVSQGTSNGYQRSSSTYNVVQHLQQQGAACSSAVQMHSPMPHQHNPMQHDTYQHVVIPSTTELQQQTQRCMLHHAEPTAAEHQHTPASSLHMQQYQQLLLQQVHQLQQQLASQHPVTPTTAIKAHHCTAAVAGASSPGNSAVDMQQQHSSPSQPLRPAEHVDMSAEMELVSGLVQTETLHQPAACPAVAGGQSMQQQQQQQQPLPCGQQSGHPQQHHEVPAAATTSTMETSISTSCTSIISSSSSSDGSDTASPTAGHNSRPNSSSKMRHLVLHRRRVSGTLGASRALFGLPAVPANDRNSHISSTVGAPVYSTSSSCSSVLAAAGVPANTTIPDAALADNDLLRQQQLLKQQQQQQSVPYSNREHDYSSFSVCGSTDTLSAPPSRATATAEPAATANCSSFDGELAASTAATAADEGSMCPAQQLDQQLLAVQHLVQSPVVAHVSQQEQQQRRQHDEQASTQQLVCTGGHMSGAAAVHSCSRYAASNAASVANCAGGIGSSSDVGSSTLSGGSVVRLDAGTQTPRRHSRRVGCQVHASAVGHCTAEAGCGSDGSSSSSCHLCSLQSPITSQRTGYCCAVCERRDVGIRSGDDCCAERCRACNCAVVVTTAGQTSAQSVLVKHPCKHHQQLVQAEELKCSCVLKGSRHESASAVGQQAQKIQQQRQQQQQQQQRTQRSCVDLSRGGAALIKANQCSDKLMFALLLASKKPQTIEDSYASLGTGGRGMPCIDSSQAASAAFSISLSGTACHHDSSTVVTVLQMI